MIKMQKFFRLTTNDDKTNPMAELIITCSNSEEPLSSKMILDLLIVCVKNDYRLLGLSYLLESFVQDSVIESFRHGWLQF